MKNLTLATLLLFVCLGAFSQNKNRALIIGVSRYKELPQNLQLQYADDDAQEFYNFIRSNAVGNIDSADIKLLLNENATAAQIYSALDELLDVTKPNDKVIIYFSGHGDIETKTVRQRGFLLAHDSPRAGYQVGGTVKLSDLQDYLETLVSLNKARIILITDACRSGKLAGGEAGATQTTAALQEQWGNITKILSSQAGELSGESSEWGQGHGVFTYNLINGLWGLADHDKDGWVSLTELNIFLSTEVPKATFDAQHPVITGNLGTKMSKVDQAKVATLLGKKNSLEVDPTMLLASNKGTFTGLDTLSKRLYAEFLANVKSGKLITPASTNAFSYYRQLSKLNEKNTPFINEMKRVLVAYLEDDVQKILNRYMKQDRTITDGEYGMAHQELDSALMLVPKNYPRYKNLTAKKLFLKADLIECTCDPDAVRDEEAKRSLALLKEAIALEPETAYLHNSLGNAYFFLEKYDSAILSYETAHQLAPAWAYPINNLGTAHRELKNYDKAIASYRQSIALAPDDKWANDMLYLTYQNILEKPHLALAFAVERVRTNPSPDTYIQLAGAYNDRYDESNSTYYYEKAIQLDSANTDALSIYAMVKYNMGDYEASEEYLEKANQSILKKKGYRDYLSLAEVNAELNKPEKAEELLPLHEQENSDENSLLDLANYYLSNDVTDKALIIFSKVMALYPNSPYAYNGAAYIKLYNKKEYDVAIGYINSAIRLDSTNADFYYILGAAYLRKNNLPEALKNLKKSVELSPEQSSYYYLALAQLKAKDVNAANTSLTKAEGLEAEYFEDFFALSDALAKKDKARSAYYKAKGYEQNDDEKNTLAYIQKAIKLNPKLTIAYSALAEWLEEETDIVKLYEQAVKSNPDWAEGFVKLAEAYEDNDQDSLATLVLERAVTLDSKNALAWEMLGDRYRQSDNDEKAITCYEKAVQIDSTKTNLLLRLGKYYAEENFQKAVQLFGQATELDPVSVEGFLELGNLFSQRKEYEKAKAYYEKAIHRDSTYYIIPENINTTSYEEVYEFKGNLPQFAMKQAVDELSAENFELAAFWLEKAARSGYDISQEKQNFEVFDAERFKKIFEQYPGYEALLQAGDELKAKGELAPAEKKYLEALASKPKSIPAHIKLAQVYKEQKKFDKVKETMDKALEVGAQDGFIHLGDIFLENNEVDYAVNAYWKAAQNKSTQIEAWLKLGDINKGLTKYDDAIQLYNKSIEAEPDYMESYFRLADLYKSTRDYDRVIATYEKASDANPREEEALIRLGDFYFYYKGKAGYDQANEQYKKALAKDSTRAMAYYRLGLIQLELKDYDQAKFYFQKTISRYKGKLLYLEGTNHYMISYGKPYLSLATVYLAKGDILQEAVMNAKGYWIENNTTRSIEWLERAAKAGYDIVQDAFFASELKNNEQYKKLVAQYPSKN